MLRRFCGSSEASPGESAHKKRSWFGRRGKYDVQTQFGVTDDVVSFKKLEDQPPTLELRSSSSSHPENDISDDHLQKVSRSSSSPSSSSSDSNRSSVHETIDAPIFVKRDRTATNSELPTADIVDLDLVHDSGIFACDKSLDFLPTHRDPAFAPRVVDELEFANRSEESSDSDTAGLPFVSIKLPTPRRDQPFLSKMPRVLAVGRTIVFEGQNKPNNDRIKISLRNVDTDTCQDEAQFQFVFKPRREFIYREFTNGEWLDATVVKNPQFQKDRPFKLSVLTAYDTFEVQLNEKVLAVCPREGEPSQYSHVVLEGDVNFSQIEFPDEMKLPFFCAIPGTLKKTKNIVIRTRLRKNSKSMKVFLQQGDVGSAGIQCEIQPDTESLVVSRRAPNTSELKDVIRVDHKDVIKRLCALSFKQHGNTIGVLVNNKPLVNYTMKEDASSFDHIFIEGDTILDDVKFNEQDLPSITRLPDVLKNGKCIDVGGVVSSPCDLGVLVTLQHGTNPNSNTGVQLSVRFHPEPLISLSGKTDGHWGNEVTSSDVPFGEGDEFRIKLSASCGQFVATVNDVRLATDFSGDVQSFTHVILDGEADFSALDFPTNLALPYISAIPESLRGDVSLNMDVSFQRNQSSDVELSLLSGPDPNNSSALTCVFSDDSKATVGMRSSDGSWLHRDEISIDTRLCDISTISISSDNDGFALSANSQQLYHFDSSSYIGSQELSHFYTNGPMDLLDVRFSSKASLSGSLAVGPIQVHLKF